MIQFSMYTHFDYFMSR